MALKNGTNGVDVDRTNSLGESYARAGAPPVRVAVVGAGPAGLYAVQALLERGSLRVDVFDELPTPYGLVRYGVAPDNQQMKSVTRVLASTFSDHVPVRFFGNVSLGADIFRDDLLELYDAVVYATGAQGEHKLGIPGESLPGVFGAKAFVDWYNGYPHAAESGFALDFDTVVVIGAGNVALDVARMLVLTPEELRATDVPDRVLLSMLRNKVTDVHVIARRGAAQAKFTSAELHRIGELQNVQVVIHPEDLTLTEADEQRLASNRQLRTNVNILRRLADRQVVGAGARIHFRFLTRPARIIGDSRARGIVLERTRLDGDQRVVGTGQFETISTGMVVRSVGYKASPLANVPFDEKRFIIPNQQGHVLDQNGLAAKEYVTGWAKRGPSGTIGNNKSDSAETVRELLAHLDAHAAPERETRDIADLLRSRGVAYTNWAGWEKLDSRELALGRSQGRPRVKIPDWDKMLELAAREEPDLCT